MRVRGLKRWWYDQPGSHLIVAPRAGAWIETGVVIFTADRLPVAPRAGAWIETTSLSKNAPPLAWSHPVRVRGLKPAITLAAVGLSVSHPVRVRGLKHSSAKDGRQLVRVAPRAGAWIETLQCC